MFFNKDSYFIERIANRANSTTLWDAVDTPEFYKPTTKFGKNLFSKSDITYKFNNYGFRSDDFDEKSDIPILFVGCSYTEGTGLPIDAVWTTQLLDKIKIKTGKTVPHWNLAGAGAGFDDISVALYWHKIKFKQPIKYIVGLFPSFNRRGYYYQNDQYKYWFHPGDYSTDHDVTDNLFIDEYFIKFQTLKNLMLIDSVAKSHGAEIIYSIWEALGSDSTAPGSIYVKEREFIQNNFPNFHYIPYPDLSNNIDYARDGKHPGPHLNKKISEEFWNNYFSKNI